MEVCQWSGGKFSEMRRVFGGFGNFIFGFWLFSVGGNGLTVSQVHTSRPHPRPLPSTPVRLILVAFFGAMAAAVPATREEVLKQLTLKTIIKAREPLQLAETLFCISSGNSCYVFLWCCACQVHQRNGEVHSSAANRRCFSPCPHHPCATVSSVAGFSAFTIVCPLCMP